MEDGRLKKMLLSEFANRLKAAQSIPLLNTVLKEYLASFDINTFAFTYYSYYPNSLNKLKYDFSTPNFSIWHQHYISEGYEDIDSTLEIVYQTTLPTFWNLPQQLKEAKSPREAQMRKDSMVFGAEKGISIPIHGPQEDFAILLLVQMKGETCLDNANEFQYDLFSAAYYYYNYLQQLLLQTQPKSATYRLNKREMQCLTLLVKQYSIESIAKTLDITERTVNYHIQRLNKKLGTQNKYQSIIKAFKKGIIKF